MTAVWMRVRAEFRSRLLAVLILGLLIGLAGGAVLAAATGARRTQTAYPRFVEAQRGLDLVLSVDMGDVSQLDVAARFPQVAESTRVYLIQGPITAPSGRVIDFPDVFPLVDPLNRFGVTMNRLKILAGRAPDPTRVDEAAVSFNIANTLGIRVGSTLRFSFNHEDVDGNPTDKPLGTELLKVVGIEAAPGEAGRRGRWPTSTSGRWIPSFWLWSRSRAQWVPR